MHKTSVKARPGSSRKVFLSILCVVAFVFTCVIGYVKGVRESPENASIALAAQGIEVTPDNFITEIYADHPENVHLFIVTGMSAATQNWENVSALLAAVEMGYDDLVDTLYATLPKQPEQQRQVLNLQDKAGKNVLIAAVERNNKQLVEKLLASGADTNLTNIVQETPLSIAVRHRYLRLIPMLLNADAQQHGTMSSLNIADSQGNTPLTYAVESHSLQTVRLLINAHANVDSTDSHSVTPMMIAAESGNVPAAEMLWSAGAKLDVSDSTGQTPLTIAIHRNYAEFVKFLIENGASPEYYTKEHPLKAALYTDPFNPELFQYLFSKTKETSAAGSDLLFKAVDRKSPEIVKMLIGAGFDPNAVNADGDSLAYHAIEAGDAETAILLMDKGAVPESTSRTAPPLELAVEHNEPFVVSKLLKGGARADQKTGGGYTLAEVAVYSGYPEVLKALLASGAQLPDVNFDILWSIRDGHGKAVDVLLDHKGDPNVMNDTGDSALWLAASMGETEAVQGLIAHKALLDYPNKGQSMSPLAIAAHTGQLSTVKLLVDAGAKIENKDAYGLTPLAHAAYMTHPEVVEYLLSKGANALVVDPQGRTPADLATLASSSPARDQVLTLLKKK